MLVAADYEPVEEQLEGYLGYLVVLDVVFVLAAILIGRALASRLVNPITRLRTAALEASAGSNAPMPRTGRGDELDDLASVLDTSFAELQLALARQKRFTADAAHELRNPLSAILSSAEVALRQERSPERNAALFGDILVETRRIDEILQALLLLARADAGSMEVRFSRVALGDLLLDLARDMQGPGPGVAVEGEALVEGDPTLLRVLSEPIRQRVALQSPGPTGPRHPGLQGFLGCSRSLRSRAWDCQPAPRPHLRTLLPRA